MRFFLLVLFVVTLFSCSPKTQKIDLVSSTEDASWVIQEDLEINLSDDESIDVIIDRDVRGQTIEGFGGCFNELGWEALKELSKTDRNVIFKELFSPNIGANFNICRMPLGANDFSLDWYSYNETEGDFEMNNFSIKNDQETLIPYIKTAQKFAPHLKIWASPWSPPAWMKYNKHYACAITNSDLAPEFRNGLTEEQQGKEGTNMFIQEEAYFRSYALYFSKFVEAYRDEGIRISTVMPQNEFNSCQIFPSCTWTSAGLATFIGQYLGPEMEKQKVDIMFGTMERPTEALVDSVINDEFANQYVKGVGFQWGGKDAVPGIHEKYPEMTLYQTEQECGNGKNDWDHTIHSWDLMKHYLSNGVNSYLYWNIALKDGGVSRWGWSQNSLISVNTAQKTYKFNHEYYLLKHVSHFVKPGAVRLKSTGTFNNLLAFENLDKSIAVVVYNDQKTEQTISLSVDHHVLPIHFKANSFSTVLIK